MPDDSPRPWTLIGFTERLIDWIDRETIDEATQRTVVAWIETRATDPYQGVELENGFPNLWWGRIPRTLHKGGFAVVICSYWINAGDRSVRCDNFGSLSWPV